MILRPEAVLILFKKPHARFLFLLLGWYVLFIDLLPWILLTKDGPSQTPFRRNTTI